MESMKDTSNHLLGNAVIYTDNGTNTTSANISRTQILDALEELK